MQPEAVADLWGPVDTEPESRWHHGCVQGTNNKGELVGVDQALLWLLYEAEQDGEPAVLCCDSCYAMEMTEGILTPTVNLAAILVSQGLLEQARETREVTFVHVKGHSADGGNDRADELVQWGKDEGPYSRIDRHGQGQGAGRSRPEPAYEARRAARLAAKRAENDVENESSRVSGSDTNEAAAQEALEDDMFRAAMESAELDGLLGEEAELAAWERAAELMAGNRWEEVEDSVSARVMEEDLPALNSLDAEGYAVFDEKSFLGWGQAAEEAGPQGLAPSAVQSQKVAVMNKT